jgi:hypothetical protein
MKEQAKTARRQTGRKDISFRKSVAVPKETLSQDEEHGLLPTPGPATFSGAAGSDENLRVASDAASTGGLEALADIIATVEELIKTRKNLQMEKEGKT